MKGYLFGIIRMPGYCVLPGHRFFDRLFQRSYSPLVIERHQLHRLIIVFLG